MTSRLRVQFNGVEYKVLATSNTTITFLTDDGPCEVQKHHCKLVTIVNKVKDFTKRPRICKRIIEARRELINIGGQELLTVSNTIEQWKNEYKQSKNI